MSTDLKDAESKKKKKKHELIGAEWKVSKINGILILIKKNKMNRTFFLSVRTILYVSL